MNDIQNGSYLMAGGIWAELNRRKSFARFATIKNLLSSHITRTLYDESRADVLTLISRKISRKEYLIKRQDEEFNEQLHKQIASVESEISTLLAFVKAFDRMAEFMQDETAGFVEEWYKTKHQNLILNQLLDAQTELAHTWGETAFKLYGDYIQQQATSTKFTNA
ncbi:MULTISPECIES: hypothetical protein [unclassified Spirosoma]|uniref:hypothetical protein n=1 Tax=unclassified Spirosoma TaxID=2621999 RepID=UPI00095A7FC2|nr:MULTISPECIES: hypothetical protein [unclassified Spirosoma]MBN8823895.1 hypothetical protein [Spirosoma sp.]OJW79713.1 MAG: hypothetical protein BGO59_00220 [Spirosoma sp. 48-14]